MSVTMLTEGPGLTGAGIKVFEDNGSKVQRIELHKDDEVACNEEILRKKKASLSRQTLKS